jgi:hypothetical protein
MTKSQTKAIAYFKDFLTSYGNDRIDGTKSSIPVTLDEFEVTTSEWGLVSVKAIRNQGPEGTMLRVLSNEYWLAFIGERGAITIKMAPRHFWNKGRHFGMNFDK